MPGKVCPCFQPQCSLRCCFFLFWSYVLHLIAKVEFIAKLKLLTGTEPKEKWKRKLIVDEQKGIPNETMKLQLKETSELCARLDLAPPTKKLMHWKRTNGVEKLFGIPHRSFTSKRMSKVAKQTFHLSVRSLCAFEISSRSKQFFGALCHTAVCEELGDASQRQASTRTRGFWTGEPQK